jgi:phosphoribosyl-ATP pyrophosphohydrolase/phosphoribosyl-AMP cyclohydrolase
LLIAERYRERPPESYTTKLFESGLKRIAQKVGEEAVETALAAAADGKEEFLEEASDLLYHLLVLLRARDSNVSELLALLRSRHEA